MSSNSSSEPGIDLPDGIITPLDLGKVQRELYSLDQFLNASKSHAPGKMPYTSPALQAMAKNAGLNLLLAEDRAQFTKQLQFVRRTAPKVQISFASDPTNQALRPLIRWLRQNGHPNTLIAVGVQPNIAGGCVVRTANQTFDFSLQKLFKANQPALTKLLV